MAADIITSVGIDLGQALKEIDRLSKVVSQLQTKLSEKTKVKVDTSEAESRFERATKLATDSVSKQKKALQDMALAGKQGSKAWTEAVAKLEKSVKAQRALKRASDQTEKAVKEINNRLDQGGWWWCCWHSDASHLDVDQPRRTGVR